MNDLITIIITTYKNKKQLDKLLKLLLKQTYRNFEVIISDDGSLDFNEKWQDYPFELKYIWQQDKGMRFCKSINNAIKLSKGKWIWFLSADLYPPNNALELYVKKKKRKLVLVGARTSDGWDGEMRFNEVPDANLFFNKAMAIKAGLWNERMIGYGYEDYEMMCRMKNICGCSFLRVREAAAEHQDHGAKGPSAVNTNEYERTLDKYES